MKDMCLLGLKVRDKVTGFVGIAATMAYDLFGCIQALVTPLTTGEGKLEESRWFDTKRLEVLDKKPVMEVPSFEEAIPGGIEKSIPRGY